MKITTKALMIVAALALAACNNPRAGGGWDDGAADGWNGGAGGIQTGALGDPNDPTSVAHFNERIGDRVFFETDQSTLTDTARQTLAAQARWLSANPQFAVLIEGHADERGTREYNVALGARRANAVMQYLVSQGINSNRMRTVSHGKERPVEACPEPRCWNQNRRAVTVVSTGLTG